MQLEGGRETGRAIMEQGVGKKGGQQQNGPPNHFALLGWLLTNSPKKL